MHTVRPFTEKNPIYSWTIYDVWWNKIWNFTFLLNIDNDNIDKNIIEHSHVYGKSIGNSVFINTNWGFALKLFVQEQAQKKNQCWKKITANKNKTRSLKFNWTE